MRKLLAVVLLVLLAVAPVCVAEIDLSGMSFDELIELQTQVNLALWETEEWQEVTVPLGKYIVGKDIPEGEWMVSSQEGHSAYINVYDDDTMKWSRAAIGEALDKGETIKLTLVNGNCVVIDISPIVFKPYVPLFSFSK